MRRDTSLRVVRNASLAISALTIALIGSACHHAAEASSPSPDVIDVHGGSLFSVTHPEQFPLVAVVERHEPRQLELNAEVAADVGRTIQVISQVPGTLVEARVQLGDEVQAGQVLAIVRSADLQQAYADLHTAAADEQLAAANLARAEDLQQHGAMPQQQVEVARDAEVGAKAHLDAARQRLQVWGADPDAPSDGSDRLPVRAPRSGVIIAQNVAGGTVIPSPDNAVSLFTLADLSQVWMLADAYENDLDGIHVGDDAAVVIEAYPSQTFHGRVSNVSEVLDPSTRTAKVRIVLDNPASRLKPGMFGTASLRSRDTQATLKVPQAAVVRSEDRSYVYLSLGGNRFQKTAVEAGSVEFDASGTGWRAVRGALRSGDRVVANAFDFESAAQVGAGS